MAFKMNRFEILAGSIDTMKHTVGSVDLMVSTCKSDIKIAVASHDGVLKE